MIGKFEQTKEGFEQKKIIIWTKPISEIPAGWVVCDGNNQTPNLSDKMLRGHGASKSSAGTTGGVNSKTVSTSQLPSHNHGITIDSTPVGEHRHRWQQNGGVITENQSRGSESFQYSFSTTQTTVNGNHSHSFSVGSTGSASTIENRPNYRKILYIMKL